MRHQPSKAVWYEPGVVPRCEEGSMIPVIVQQGGKVFGAWYLNTYPLMDEYDSIDAPSNEEGVKIVTGFTRLVEGCCGEDFYETGSLGDMQCWAYMPEPLVIPRYNA